jgi:replicative DNA helicase
MMDLASTLPANIEAERSILGAILLDNQAYLEASDRLTAADFSLDSHRRIYSRMVNLMESNRPVDMITLIDELNLHRDLQAIGDVAYVSGLIEGVPDRPSIISYIDIVRDRAQQRGILRLCEVVTARIANKQDDAAALLADMEEALLRIAGRPRKMAQPLREVLQRTLNQMAAERDRTAEYIGIPTGVHDLDQLLGGIRESELWIVAADTGGGKTSFGVQFAMNAVKMDVPTVDFTLEMKDWQVARRILAAHTPAEAFGARDAKLLGENTWHDVIEGAAQLATLPLFIDDTADLSIAELRSRVKLYKKRFGVRLIVVDYLRLLTATGRDTRERVTNIALGLANLAKEEEISILALSQLARKEEGKMPSKHDLKESGDLENAAHVVMLLWRPKQDGHYTGDDLINVDKAREGPLSLIPCWYDESTLQFKPRFLRGLK